MFNITPATSKAKQELQTIANKLCYALPYAALNGKINILSIEPAFAMQVESEKLKNSRHCERSEAISTKQEQIATATPRNDVEITIYDIFGRQVLKQSYYTEHSDGYVGTINISNLQKGIYIVKLGDYTAKFIKE